VQISRGVTTRRVFSVLPGYATRPVMLTGCVLADTAASLYHNQEEGTYAAAPAISYFSLKRTQNNGSGRTIMVLGPYDVTYFKKVVTAFSSVKNCATGYFAWGLFPESSGIDCSAGFAVNVKDNKAGAVVGSESAAAVVHSAFYKDITSLIGRYYLYFECFAQDLTSTAQYNEMAIRTVQFEV
jgi:hypothetical protein